MARALASSRNSNGLVPQNTLDWALGLDFTLPADTRFNVQVFQRQYFSHDPDLISDKRENGVYRVIVVKGGESEVREGSAVIVEWVGWRGTDFNHSVWRGLIFGQG